MIQVIRGNFEKGETYKLHSMVHNYAFVHPEHFDPNQLQQIYKLLEAGQGDPLNPTE